MPKLPLAASEVKLKFKIAHGTLPLVSTIHYASGFEPIAIVGMGCVLPDAFDVESFWRHQLQGYSAIKTLKDSERVRWSRYFSSDRSAPDKAHALRAARVENYRFD